jgi:hypothetical protein
MAVVGSGFADLTNPGGESSGAVGVVVMPFVSGTGQVCLFGEDYLYDGISQTGEIAFLADDGTNLRFKLRNIVLNDAIEYADLWFVLTSGAGEGTWYKINARDGANLYVSGFSEATFAGAVGDTISIGEIWAYRDFAHVRPNGSVKFTGASIDHDGADGDDTATAKNQLYISTFACGMRPSHPLPFFARTQMDESASDIGEKMKRISHTRTAQGRIRLEARVRSARISVRKIDLLGKEWER